MKVSKELGLAASLVDGGAEKRGAVSYEGVVKVLKANAVPLLRVAGAEDRDSFRSSRRFRQELAEEEERYNLNRCEYKRVREAFLSEGIESILFKSTGILPSFPYTFGNLDMLIKPEFLQKARSVLRQIGYVELKNIEEPKKFLFKRFESGREMLALHLHTQVGWGVPFLDNEFIWRRDRITPADDPLVSIPSPEASLLVLLAHSLYEEKAIKLRELVAFHHLMGKSIDWGEAISQAQRRGWLDGFFFTLLLYDWLEREILGVSRIPEHIANKAADLLHTGLAYRCLSRLKKSDSVEMPFGIPFLFSKVLYYRKILADERRGIWRKLHDVAATVLWGAELKLKIRSQPSMLIGLSGVDGAGKSLQAELLTEAFKRCGIQAMCIWNRCASTAFAGLVIRGGKALFTHFRLGGQRGSGRAGSVEERKRYLESKFIRSLWPFVILTELTVQYNLKVRPLLLLGKVVICDRYLLDALVELGAYTRDRDVANRTFAKLLRCLNPVPHMSFFLDVPAQAVVRRKREEPMEHIHAQVLLYREMGKEFGVTPIDGGGTPGEVSDEIVRKTLTRYYGNFHTFLKGLLLSNPSQLNP